MHPMRYILQNHFLTGILFIAIGWFVLEVRGILMVIFASYIIMAAHYPAVAFLRRRKIPNTIAVVIPFLLTLLFLVLLIFPLIPFFVAQIQALIVSFPLYLKQAGALFGIDVDASQVNSLITSELATIGKNAYSVTSKLFGGIFSLLTVVVVSFYLLLDYDRIKRSIILLFPNSYHDGIAKTLTQVELKLGAWLRGQMVLSLFIGGLTWAFLTILGLDFALPLALIAGILEIVPTIGPIISSIPALIVALAISPTMTLIVGLGYLGIQILENNILVPKIMEKAVGLNPILIIIAVMTGAKLMGVIGALLAIPFLSMLIIILQTLRTEENK